MSEENTGTVEFVRGEDGAFKVDPATKLPLIKKADGKEEPLDPAKLFAGIGNSNRDAAANRKEAEAVKAANAALEAKLAKMEKEMAEKDEAMKALKANQKDPVEAAWEERVTKVEKELEKARQEKEALEKENKRREVQRQIEAAFSDCGYIAERGHIPMDFWLARYRGNCAIEDVNGVMQLVVKDLNGHNIMSEKTPTQPASLSEALAVLCASRPKAGDVNLNPAPFGGSGAKPANPIGSNNNPFDPKHPNITQQHQLLATDPAMASRLAAEAGVKLAI